MEHFWGHFGKIFGEKTHIFFAIEKQPLRGCYFEQKKALLCVVFSRVIDGFDTLDELEKLPVNEKHRPEREVRIRSVTIHANPMAEKDFKPDR